MNLTIVQEVSSLATVRPVTLSFEPGRGSFGRIAPTGSDLRPPRQARFMEATEVAVREVRTVGPDTVALEVETPVGFDALPGQFVLVRAEVDGEEYARHYTISSPAIEETFEITVGVDPEGSLSPWLADREAGDTLQVEGPFGTISYDAGEDDDVVVVAGGPGVGPAVGVGEAAVGGGHDAAVVYEDDAPAHEDRLAGLAAAGSEVVILGDGAGLADAVSSVVGGDGDSEYYVFGFDEFIQRAQSALEDAGVDPDDVLVENFG